MYGGKICLSVCLRFPDSHNWMDGNAIHRDRNTGREAGPSGGGEEGWKGTMCLSLDLLSQNAFVPSSEVQQAVACTELSGDDSPGPVRVICGWSAIRRIFEARGMTGHLLRRREGVGWNLAESHYSRLRLSKTNPPGVRGRQRTQAREDPGCRILEARWEDAPGQQRVCREAR